MPPQMNGSPGMPSGVRPSLTAAEKSTTGSVPVGRTAFPQHIEVEVRREDVQVRQRIELVKVLARDLAHGVVGGKADGGHAQRVASGRLRECATPGRTIYA